MIGPRPMIAGYAGARMAWFDPKRLGRHLMLSIEPARPLGGRRELLALVAASRLAVIAVGIATFLAFRSSANEDSLELGGTADVLAAPFYRLDALAYVDIAQRGYDSTPPGYFPVYPALLRGIGEATSSLIVGGVLLSITALVVALVLLHRLAVIEVGEAAARRTVYIVALFPTTVYFSAVYTESVFLLVSVGCLLAARTGHWATAGLLGMVASATRNTGVVLMAPLVMLYLYGPRGDGEPPVSRRSWRRPHRLRLDAMWIGLVPLGLVAYSLYCAVAFDDGLAWLHSHAATADRSLQVPLSGLVFGTREGISGIVGLLVGGDEPRDQLASDAVSFAILVFTLTALVGAMRRLPPAYGLYAALSISVPLTSFNPDQPLTAFARYILPVFPLYMWVALWAHSKQRFGFVLALAAAGMAAAAAAFSLGRLA